jgi:hypothetical protein
MRRATLPTLTLATLSLPNLLRLLVLTAALVGGARGAEAHPHTTAPPVDLTLLVHGKQVRGVLIVDKWLLGTWGMPPNTHPNLKRPLPEEDLVRRLETRLDVRFDGQHVVPTLEDMTEPASETLDRIVPIVRLALGYAVDAAPREVTVTWHDFQGIVWEKTAEVALQIEANGNVDTKQLTPTEPQYRWHERPPPAFRAPLPPLPVAPQARRLPALALGLGLAGLLLPLLPALRRRGGAARWLPAAALLLAGAGAGWTGVGSVALDASVAGPPPPTEREARQIATTLLTNVYRAFDAEGEKAVYDVLAASVERPLLGGLYADVRESLVLREQGGAVARIADVTFDDGTPKLDGGDGRVFEIDQPWKVRGAVSHWGHTHERLNLYRARLRVRHDGTAWRIAGIEMIEHKRLDDGTNVVPSAPDAPEGAATPGKPG